MTSVGGERSTRRHPSTAGEQLRLMTVAARLYHVHHVRQRDIGERLGMSQARVSRMLRQAEDDGIVRTVVAVPEGVHPELEDVLERTYGLLEAHVVDVPEGPELAPELGRTAARYLVEATPGGARIGFTSWSLTLQAMARALPELPRAGVAQVVEMLGDLGSPAMQHAAARSTQAFARALGATPVFLRVPGVLPTADLRSGALRDPHVQQALSLLDDLDLAFVGVGPAGLHSQLQAEDNYFSARQLEEVRRVGAVGQLNQRFLDAEGTALDSPLDALVVGATLDQLRSARRRVVVAGGEAKHVSLAAALRGGWVDVLVTDVSAARFLADSAGGPLSDHGSSE